MTALYRFTRDLRLEDHAGLSAAASLGEIVPVLIMDASLRDRLHKSGRRAAFFCAAVESLDASLRARGTGLIVRRGEPAELLLRIARETDAQGVVWSASYDATGMQQDAALQEALQEQGLRVAIATDAPAAAPDAITAGRTPSGGYRAFAPYYDRWREIEPLSYEAPLLLAFARTQVESEPLPTPADFGSSCSAKAGESEALTRWRSFLETGIFDYAIAVNLPADDRTSHLGAELSFGTIAARRIVREARRRLQDPFLLSEERGSLRLFLRSLALRDFFLQLSWHHPQTANEPLQEKMRGFRFASAHPKLEAWRRGETGYPLVDAGIRQLHACGWMHPRVRSVAASFLCFDLGVDWRIGIDEWDKHLMEDDPALAIGNWQWIAGVGADLAAYPRIYNPQKQLRRFDPEGRYARRWIAEFADAPQRSALSASRAAQLGLPLYAKGSYPAPVVEHEPAAREFLRRYRSFTPPSDRRATR